MKNEKLVDAIGMIKDEYIEEAHSPKKKFTISFDLSMLTKLAAAAVCILLAVTILPNYFSKASSGGNGSYEYSASASAPNAVYDEEAYSNNAKTDESAGISSSLISNKTEANKKLILTADLEMETQNLDDITSKLSDSIKKHNGYVQSSSIYSRGNYTREYHATIRIPANEYESFLNEIKDSGNTIRYSEHVDDVTDAYTDTQARLSSLRAQYDKVLEFYNKAETIEDLMAVETRLSELQYEIEYLEARIKNYDLLVDYSTLNITISETTVYTPTNTNFFTRLGNSFVNGFHNFADGIGDFIIDLVYNIWTILFFVVIAYIGYRVYKKIRNKRG